MGQKNALAQETEQIENLLAEIDQYLNGKTRSELIAKSQGKQVQLVITVQLKKFEIKQIS
jgi:hypothetical protein